MAQFVYLIAAMLALATLLMTSQQGTERVRQTQMLNEVSTQLTTVATEALETIGRAYYDRYVFTNRSNESAQCGRVANGLEGITFTDEASFVPCADFATCNWIEGFDDLRPGPLPGAPDTTVVRGGHGDDKGFTVNLEVEVQYVDPADYTVLPGAQTFAKQVAVTAHTPDAYVGDDPSDYSRQFSITLTRVFVYGCPTDPNDIPQPAAGQTCEDVGFPVCAFDTGT